MIELTKIAVESGLRPFEVALKDAGFVVVQLSGTHDLHTAHLHAVVVSGMDDDFLGLPDAGNTPVINAVGRTPEEVVNEVRRSLGPRE